MDWAEIGTLAALLAAGALLSGFLAGLLGIGGGAVTVPVLYQVLTTLDVASGVRMQVAVGTSLALIIPTSIRSLRAHMARGAVDLVLLKQWLITVPLGAILGGAIANLLPSDVLAAIFAAIALVLGLRMLIGKLPFVLGSDLPGRVGRTVAGLLIGGLSAIMGIGGGVLNNTFMTLYGRPMHQAVATSAGVGVLIAIPGIVPFIVGGWGHPDLPPLSLGNVSLAALAILIPMSMPTVKLGATLAHRLTRRQLEVGFGLFLLTVALRFMVSAF
ncbi:sulfite exporter TauE/SafE family protein [Aureimonas phyllosphaerae]|uniref:Probable membrane transporter protein n=1 Tax=Aureimonas phyllosphaerae TaxID=1166078 RepID=A0A7W6BSG9_9HYPH|nr:sulfite exporter TauE/SafE family protein [Aureimonas phyllosphaerae]MBB3935495.1 putative membrane protein YfcA [Aureimonas phyllosphaerae]MBB3959503.1 putative membrane protein YfcA [Aureimonas phyllosphaerae]SFF11359.1 Uncharacterized membrane protein YfcA [Aureimonas phyllosphaerae]